MKARPFSRPVACENRCDGWNPERPAAGLDADGSKSTYRAGATCARELIRKRGSIRRAFCHCTVKEEA
jgi:hypothetical protein